MMKKLLSVFAVMLMLCCLLTTSVFAVETSGQCGDNAYWEFDKTTATLTISGEGAIWSYDWPHQVPWSGFKAAVKYVIVDVGIVQIGENNFCGCTGLIGVDLPESLYMISDSAFAGCNRLTEIVFPEGVKEIGEEAFLDCISLSCVEFSDALIEIGQDAFRGCTVLTSVDIPDGVMRIPRSCFSGCSALKSVELSNSLSTIDWRAFADCIALEFVEFPDSLTKIEYGAFDNCVSLKEVKFSDNLKLIGEKAFFKCYALTNVILPKNLVEIQLSAFEDCSGLVSVEFFENLTTIGTDAFLNCTSLICVKLPDSVTSMGRNAFKGCTSLKELQLPYFIGEIESNMFVGCESLENVVVPPGVSVIGFDAFSGCTALKRIELPLGLSEVKPGAFYKCDNLCEVIYEGTDEQWGRINIYHNNEPLLNARNGLVTPAPTPTPTPTPDPEPVVNPFNDISENDWYYNSVMWAYEKGITGGIAADLFGPEAGCTRGQVVTFLWAAAGKPEPETKENPFTDVADDAWYLQPVLWAVENGITNGISETEFGPENTCTRAQIVTFLYAAQQKPDVSGSSTFADVADDAWYLQPVLWAVENGVTSGIGDGMFGSDNTCTRCQVVTFLYKVYGDK